MAKVDRTGPAGEPDATDAGTTDAGTTDATEATEAGTTDARTTDATEATEAGTTELPASELPTTVLPASELPTAESSAVGPLPPDHAQQPYPQQPYAQQPYRQQPYPQQPYAQQPYAQQSWPPQLPTYGGWEDAHGAPTASDALRRAFAGVTAGDVVRDGLAALLLLFALTLPWDYGHDGLGRLEVVVVTAVSLASLVAAYLARAGAYGSALDTRRAGLLRFVLNVPYLVVVVGFLVGDAFVGDQPEMVGGVGAGLGVGLAGAVLAMAPRVAELDGRNRLDRAWLTVPAVIGAVAVVWVLAGLMIFVVGDEAEFYSSAGLLRVLLTVLLGPAVLVLGVVGVLRRDEGWRLAFVAIGVAPIVLHLVAEAGAAPGILVESVHALPRALVLWPAAAAAAAAPSARRAMRVTRARWADAAGRVLTLAIVAAAVDLVASVLTIADSEEDVRWIVLAVLALAYLAAAVGARALVREGRRLSPVVALGTAGVLFLLGIVSVLGVMGSEWSGVTEIDLFLALALPIALVGVVLAHLAQDARGTLGHPAVPEAPAWGAPSPPPTPPGVAPGAAHDPVSDAVRQAQDPTTPQVTLADLATRVPATRVHIARHPAAYPDLLDWLAALGDPEVSRAVAERRGH